MNTATFLVKKIIKNQWRVSCRFIVVQYLWLIVLQFWTFFNCHTQNRHSSTASSRPSLKNVYILLKADTPNTTVNISCVLEQSVLLFHTKFYANFLIHFFENKNCQVHQNTSSLYISKKTQNGKCLMVSTIWGTKPNIRRSNMCSTVNFNIQLFFKNILLVSTLITRPSVCQLYRWLEASRLIFLLYRLGYSKLNYLIFK